MTERSLLRDWTPEEIARGHDWVETWRRAGRELERIRRLELRNLDTYRAIEMLCGDAGDVLTSVHRTTTGLQEQQRWFRKAAANH